MKYNKAKETVELLKAFKEDFEETSGTVMCASYSCSVCPFIGSSCTCTNRKERYAKVCDRLEELEGVRRYDFKVGDRVWLYGLRIWGTVTKVSKEPNSPYPVRVEFEDGKAFSFTSDGKFISENTYRDLYFEEIPIPDSALYTTDKPDVIKLTVNDKEVELSAETLASIKDALK